MSSGRKCRKCDVALVVGETWSPSTAKKGGRTCRACDAEATRAWNADPANKEKARETKKRYIATPKGRAVELLGSARDKAKTDSLGYDLDEHRDELVDIIRDGNCHDSGLPFDLSSTGGMVCGAPWNLPSLDRREAGGDYTWANVRVVLWAVNSMRGDLSIPMFHALCHVLSENLTKRYGPPDLSVLLPDLLKETDSEDTP